jgi:outer membrane lipoprotein-sorting protein
MIVKKLFVTLALAPVLFAAETIETVQSRMDQAAANFKALTATLTKISYTAVIKDSSKESGTIFIKRSKPGEILVRIEFTEPDVRSVTLSRKKYEEYLPKIATVQEVDLGKNGSLVDQFLLLGFGTPVKDLLASYSMKVTGSEDVNGQPATRIELLPKSGKVMEHLTKIEMWIPLTEGVPVQQKFHQKAGNYYLSTYSDMKLNPPLTDADLQLKLPKGVKRTFPQK